MPGQPVRGAQRSTPHNPRCTPHASRTCFTALLVATLLGITACAAPRSGGAPSAAGQPANTPAAGAATTGTPVPASAAPASAAAVATAPAPPVVAAPLSPPVTMKLATTGNTGEAGIYVALDKGYFQAEGLDIDLINFRSGAEALTALTVGEVRASVGSPEPILFNAVERGLGVRVVAYTSIIGPDSVSGGFTVRQDHLDTGRFRGPADFRGMSVSMPSPGAIAQNYLERALALGGGTPADITQVPLTFPDMPVAYANRSIDAAYQVEPYVSIAEQQGLARMAVPNSQIYLGAVTQVMTMSGTFTRDQPEAARRFVTAHLRGQRDLWRAVVKKEIPLDEITAAIVKYTALKDAAMLGRALAGTIDPNGEMDPRPLEAFQDYYVQTGAQAQRVSMDRVLDPTLAADAVQRLGRIQ